MVGRGCRVEDRGGTGRLATPELPQSTAHEEDVMKGIVLAALAVFTLSACASLTHALTHDRLPSPEYSYSGGD
jgi:hypothetical protein